MLKAQPISEAISRLPHRAFDRAQLVVFAGRRGHGKTTALRAYLEEREPRVLALDPFNDFRWIRRRLDSDDALEELESGEPCRRRLVPSLDISTIDYAEHLFGALIERRIGDLLVVLDELTLWTRPTESAHLRTLVLQGRRLGIRLAVACQRISLVPGVLLSEATELILFRTSRPRDLEVISEWTDKETSETVRKLQVGECVPVIL